MRKHEKFLSSEDEDDSFDIAKPLKHDKAN